MWSTWPWVTQHGDRLEAVFADDLGDAVGGILAGVDDHALGARDPSPRRSSSWPTDLRGSRQSAPASGYRARPADVASVSHVTILGAPVRAETMKRDTRVTSTEWGRVADDGTVFVKTADGERAVGQYPAGTPEEALKFFTDRFERAGDEVSLLDQRVRSAVLSPEEATESVKTVRAQVVDANAVGDLASLVGAPGLARPGDRPAARGPQGREGAEGGRVEGPRRRSWSPRPRSSPPATTGATAPTGSASSSTSGRRSPASTGPPTTRCGSGSRPRARRTPVAARRTSPSRTRSARAPAWSRSGWSRRPRRWPTPPSGARPPAGTAT